MLSRYKSHDTVRQYLLRITQPKTAEDFALALQNPTTLIYQRVMYYFNLRLLETEIVTKLLEEYSNKTVLANKVEKENLHKKLIEIEVQRKTQQQIFQNEPSQSKKHSAPDDIFNVKQNYEKMISVLNEKLSAINKQHDENNASKTNHIIHWRQLAESNVAYCEIKMRENNIHFVNADGSPVSEEKHISALKALSGMDSPPLVDVIQKVKDSHRIARELNPSTDEIELNEDNLRNHLLLINSLRCNFKLGGNNPEAILKINARNKPAIDYLNEQLDKRLTLEPPQSVTPAPPKEQESVSKRIEIEPAENAATITLIDEGDNLIKEALHIAKKEELLKQQREKLELEKKSLMEKESSKELDTENVSRAAITA